MIRTLDPAPFIAIAGHPDVWPWLGVASGSAEQILAPTVSNPANFALMTPQGDGAYLLARLQPGLYAAHTIAMPAARGRPMLRLMREGFQFMFTQTDAVEIVTQCPDGNENARRWSDVAGFRDTFRRERCFPMGGELVGAQFRSLTWHEWANASAVCRTAGSAFFDTLSEHGEAVGTPDVAARALLGAALMCATNGLIGKGAALYNRWALIAGLPPLTVVSDAPPVIAAGSAIVGLSGGVLTVLSSTSTREARPFAPKDGTARCQLAP